MKRLMNALLTVIKYEANIAKHRYWWPTALADARRERDDWMRWCKTAEARNQAVIHALYPADTEIAQTPKRES